MTSYAAILLHGKILLIAKLFDLLDHLAVVGQGLVAPAGQLLYCSLPTETSCSTLNAESNAKPSIRSNKGCHHVRVLPGWSPRSEVSDYLATSSRGSWAVEWESVSIVSWSGPLAAISILM